MENNLIHGYSPDPGLPEAREATAVFLRSRKNIRGASASSVMLTCGANQAFVNALLTVTCPGDEVIIFAPYYFDHVFAVKLAGCSPITVDLVLDEEGYKIDFDRLQKSLSPRTRVVVFVSPGNPTGRVPDIEETKTLCEFCNKNDLWLFSDETYDMLTFAPATHVSPATLMPTDRTVVMGSFSKTFGLAAWRVGYLCGPSTDFVEEVIKVQDALVVCAPVPSQMAALGALEQIDTFVPEALAELTRRKDAMLSTLKDCKTLEAVEPRGGTSLLARITTKAFKDSFEYSKRLLQEKSVITVPGSAFGPRGEGHIRLSFGNQPPEVIAQAVERIREFEP